MSNGSVPSKARVKIDQKRQPRGCMLMAEGEECTDLANKSVLRSGYPCRFCPIGVAIRRKSRAENKLGI